MGYVYTKGKVAQFWFSYQIQCGVFFPPAVNTIYINLMFFWTVHAPKIMCKSITGAVEFQWLQLSSSPRMNSSYFTHFFTSRCDFLLKDAFDWISIHVWCLFMILCKFINTKHKNVTQNVCPQSFSKVFKS